MRKLKWVLAAMILSLAAGCERAEVKPKAPPAAARAHHVLIVSIDGCRPDVLLRAQMDELEHGEKPVLAQLMSEGSFTFWAETIPAAITLPSHTSMLTGMDEDVHGITWNDPQPEDKIQYPRVPTLFEIAKRHGLTTAIFSDKTKFFNLARPGTIDWGFINKDPDDWVDDEQLTGKAAEVIKDHKPNVTFLHLGKVDAIGHGQVIENGVRVTDPDRGWGSQEQVEAVEEMDHCIGIAVQALKDAGIYNDTLIIVTADHGGAGFSHGPNDARSRHIPWICVGPGVRENYDLTRSRDRTIKTQDTFATAVYFLGLPMPDYVVGRPVLEIIRQRELHSGSPG